MLCATTTKQEEHQSRLKYLEQERETLHAQMVQNRSTLNKVVCQVEDLYENKTSKLETLDHEQKIQSHIKSMFSEQTKIFDAMNSLENWVEKYLPLKL